MRQFNVIIVAGGEKGPLYETTKFVEKALLPIHGIPMVSRVIDAFHACEQVENIVVVGSANLDDLESMKKVRKRIFTGMTLVQNIVHAITYVKHRLYRSASDHDGYVISFCDAVFLTPEIIADTLRSIESTDGDLVLHYVEKTSFEDANLPVERTYIPVAGKNYTGTTIYYVKKFRHVITALPKLAKLRKYRKDPEQLLEILACSGKDIPEIEQALSQELDIDVKIRVSPHPELGLDVDKPTDLELAVQLLS
ncbi:MAG: nucleotidyltransferase family protein [Pirellulaceae bacterium]